MPTTRSRRLAAALAVAAAVGTTTILAATSSASAHEGHGAHASRSLPAGARAALARLAKDVAPYADPAAAQAAGWFPVGGCAALPDGSAAMGYHYLNPALLAGPPDPAKPPMLVYVPALDGGLTLGAVEWFVPDADQDLSTDDDRPSVLGVPFDGPMPGHEPGMPVHYDLHAWVGVANPAGILQPFNPAVSCP
ncbi:hypothetical protein ACK8HX_10705 [Oryzobacter sp. R7]|uniref:hypothetical protein n=1 Tax=Oryzobacter faecalis TaxID=3388656 RepID=UPI00398CF2DD